MTTRNNTGHGQFIGRDVEMDEYDKLPAEIRRTLQNAPLQFGAHSFGAFYRQRFGRYDAAEIASMIEQNIRGMLLGDSAISTQAKWTWTVEDPKSWIKSSDGKNHPQADASYPWRNYQVEPTKRGKTQVIKLRRA